MNIFCIVLEKYNGKQSKTLSNYTKINCHLIFDVKMGENFLKNKNGGWRICN